MFSKRHTTSFLVLPSFIISSFSIPHFVYAEATYKLLAPLGPLAGPNVTMAQYLEGIIQVIIGVAGVFAVVMIVICGVQLIGSPSVSQKSASKQCITSAILGLVLTFSSWIILNTINTQLLSTTVGLIALPKVEAPAVIAQGDAPMPSKPGFYFRYKAGGAPPTINSPRWDTPDSCLEGVVAEEKGGGVIVPIDGKKCFQVFAPAPGVPPDPNAPVPPPAADAQVRMDICGNNLCIGATPVGINKGPCTYSAQTDCTSVAGLPQSVVDALKTLGGVAGPVVLSGGTEAGHKTHGPGQVVFDLRMTQKLDEYVKKNATQSAASFTGCRYRLNIAGNDFWFTNEAGAPGGAHWHICALNQPYWYCTNKTKTGEALPAAPNNYTPGCPKLN